MPLCWQNFHITKCNLPRNMETIFSLRVLWWKMRFDTSPPLLASTRFTWLLAPMLVQVGWTLEGKSDIMFLFFVHESSFSIIRTVIWPHWLSLKGITCHIICSSIFFHYLLSLLWKLEGLLQGSATFNAQSHLETFPPKRKTLEAANTFWHLKWS